MILLTNKRGESAINSSKDSLPLFHARVSGAGVLFIGLSVLNGGGRITKVVDESSRCEIDIGVGTLGLGSCVANGG